MSRYVTPAGVVEARPIVQKSTGQLFIQDPQGQLWRLVDCKFLPPEEDPCPTITPQDWANLKETAREIHIPDRLFVEILERVTGIPIPQFQAGSLTYNQWADSLIRLEEAAFTLQVCCPLPPTAQVVHWGYAETNAQSGSKFAIKILQHANSQQNR